jgi:hypothetical protein
MIVTVQIGDHVWLPREKTPDSSAFAVVEIAGDRLEIRGFGREPSRSLTLKTA